MNEEKEDSEDFGFNIHYHKEDETTDNIDDLEEDIPFPENWERVSLDKGYYPDYILSIDSKSGDLYYDHHRESPMTPYCLHSISRSNQ